jgi:hypothetical protein
MFILPLKRKVKMFLFTCTHERFCRQAGSDEIMMHMKDTYTNYQSISTILCITGYIGLGALTFNGTRKAYHTVTNFNMEKAFLPQIFGKETSAWQKAKKIALFISEVFAGIVFIGGAWVSSGGSLLTLAVSVPAGLIVIHGAKFLMDIYNKLIASQAAPSNRS